MKYSENNKPLVCMMTNSTCYNGTTTGIPVGILWHSTGANNTTIRRYVQPSDNDPNKAELITKIGKNQYGNDWNHTSVQAGVNAWIGKLADGSVSTVQGLPWNYRPWGCGKGSKGSCNGSASVKNSPFWIQFECCEDSLTNKDYFEAVYKEGCELTAYLCKMYDLDPYGTINYSGVKVPVILDHAASCSLGLGSNHGDITHWLKKYGKSLDTIRKDVYDLLHPVVIEEEEEDMTQERFNELMDNWVVEQAEKAPSDWSKTYRDWAEAKGLIQGDENGNTMYKKYLTREEFVTVLYRALGGK